MSPKKIETGNVIKAHSEINKFFPAYFKRFAKKLLNKRQALQREFEIYEDSLKQEFFVEVYKYHPDLKSYHFDYNRDTKRITVGEKKLLQ